MTAASEPVVLRAAGVAVVIDASPPGLPRVLHWGADPGASDPTQVSRIGDYLVGAVPGGADRPTRLTLFPTEGDLWSGTPGVAGHREGERPFPRFELTSVETPRPGRVLFHACDELLGLELVAELVLEPDGLLRSRATLTNAPTDVSASTPSTV
jgi:alpha-galactosidase